MPGTIDIAHVAFLESISEAITSTGAAAAKGSLMRRAVSIANQLPETAYDSLDAWEAAVKAQTHPITRLEGPSVRHGSLFALPACPFAPSIRTYKEVFKQLPAEFSQIVVEYNKPGKACADLHVGHGSGVSPFCAMHQALRSAAGRRITVGGKGVQVIQLGCKAADGRKAISDHLCAIAAVDRQTVDQHLDGAMCVYAVKTSSP